MVLNKLKLDRFFSNGQENNINSIRHTHVAICPLIKYNKPLNTTWQDISLYETEQYYSYVTFPFEPPLMTLCTRIYSAFSLLQVQPIFKGCWLICKSLSTSLYSPEIENNESYMLHCNKTLHAWFQASVMMCMRSVLFWDVRQCRVVMPCWCFRETYQSHLQQSRNFLTLEECISHNSTLSQKCMSGKKNTAAATTTTTIVKMIISQHVTHAKSETEVWSLS